MSSTSFQELAASPLGSSEQECEQSRSVKSIPTAEQSCESTGPTFPSSRMSANSPQPTLTGLTLSAAASRVRTSAQQGPAKGWMEAAADCGWNTRALLATLDLDTSSWKTSQLCLSGEWDEFSETWPESGMTQSGRLFRLAPWAHHMCDDECSLWPTPTASMDGRGFGIPLHERSGRYKKSTVRRVHALVGEHGWRIHPHFTETLMGYETGWTEIEPSETPSSQTSQRRSAAQSCKPKGASE
jgi:hypothetical protein